MKIQVRLSKRATAPPVEISALVTTIAGTEHNELTALLESYTSWVWPRSDLHAWIEVLNAFDAVLERIVTDYAVDKLQIAPFKPTDKRLLLEILRFERLLLENSTNRKLFSSYDRLNALLGSCDLDVSVAVLQLLLRPAQQYSAQPSVAHVLNITPARLEALARRWPNLAEHGLDNADLVTPKKHAEVDALPAAASDVKFTFYRRNSDEKEPEPQGTSVPQTPAKKPASTGGAPLSSQQTVRLASLAAVSADPMNILAETVKANNVPASEQFELMCKIRSAWALGKGREVARDQLSIIRMLAIALYAHTQSESHAQTALFLYEPDMVAHLAEFLQRDRDISIPVQAAVIAALDGLVRYRSKMQEVLTAVNVGVNHGILMTLLRSVVVESASAESTVPSSFIEAILAFVSFIATHAAGGNMIVGAGIVPLLVQIIENKQPSRLSVVSKTMSLLDGVLFGFSNSFNIFCNARGVEALVDRIEHEVDYDVGLKESSETIPVARTNVLKHLLRSIHRMMQSPGTTEGLRGLIDSSILKTLKKIFTSSSFFGPVILPIAVNIMSTFVHNEPSSLAVLQEVGLPEVFYDAVESGLDPAFEVLQAIPNAIGALCLNQAGQDLLTNRTKTIPTLFSVFTSERHAKMLHEKENAALLGNAFDELIRHHPNLKDAVFEAVAATLVKIEEFGSTYTDPNGLASPFKLQLVPHMLRPSDHSDLLQHQAMEYGQPRPPTPIPMQTEEDEALRTPVSEAEAVDSVPRASVDVTENLVVLFVDVLGRFLEGFFQHTQHCREFVSNTDGLERLARLFTLPCIPSEVSSSDYFASIIHTIAEVAPTQMLQKLTKQVGDSLEETQDLWKEMNSESKFAGWVAIPSDGELSSANAKFRKLITLQTRLSMLAEVYSTSSVAHARSANSSLQNITATETSGLISLIGDLHRSFIWENTLLKSALPDRPQGPRVHVMEYGTVPIDLLPAGFAASSVAPRAVDNELPPGSSSAAVAAANAKQQNIEALKQLVGGIPSAITSFMQSLVKMVLAGRRNLDPSHKKHTVQLAKQVSDTMVKHFAWNGEVSPLALSAYRTVMIGFATVVLSGEHPSQHTVQALLLISLWQAGVIHTIVDIANNWVTDADEIMAIKAVDRDEFQNQRLIHAFGGLKVALHVLLTVVSSKPLFESSQTPLLVTTDIKDTDPKYFEPHDLLVRLRGTVLPLLKRMWTERWISGPPLSITKSVVTNMLEIMRADKEDAAADGPSTSSGAGSGRHGIPQPVGPDENRIRQLCEMGFPRSAVERALVRTSNNIAAATELLLAHPLPFPRDPDPEPEAEAEAAPGSEAEAEADAEVEPEAEAEPEAGAEHVEAVVAVAAEGSGEAAAIGDAPATDGTALTEPDAAEPAVSVVEDAIMEEVSAEPITADKGKGKDKEVVPESEPTPTPSNKPTQECRDELNTLRAEIRETLLAHAFKLIDEHPNLIFDVKSAFVGGAGSTSTDALKLILEDIKSFSPSAFDIHELPLAVRLQLLGLVLTDTTAAAVKLSQTDARALMNVLLALVLSQEPPLQDGFTAPKWLGALLMSAELLLGMAEEAPALTLPKEDDPIEAGPSTVGPDYTDARPKLFDFALRLLQTQGLSRDDLLASLRLLVVLTRDHKFASEFIKRDGLSRLMQLFREPAQMLVGLEVYIAILMRHAAEEEEVLNVVMSQEIRRFFGQSRSRVVDLNAFVRGASHLVLRDAQAFTKAAAATCMLSGSNNQHIQLKATAAAQSASKEPDSEMNVDEPTPSAAPKASALDSVVQYLIAELVRVTPAALEYASGTPAAVVAPQTVPAVLPEPAATSGSAEPQPTDGIDAPSEPAQDDLEADGPRSFSYACLLMQALTELLFSYEAAKSAFLSHPRLAKSGSSSTKDNRGRPSTLGFLLQEMISHGNLNAEASSDVSKRRMLLCNWAASVIVSLAVDVSPIQDYKDTSSELSTVRKTVLDGVNKAIRDTAAIEALPARYGRLVALAELCYRLLTVKVNSPNKAHEDGAIHTAKIMLEKGFVATLTNTLAEVDLNFPNIKNLVSAILRPLEYLTRVAIKMGRTTDPTKAAEEKDDAMSTDYSDEDGEDDNMTDEDMPREATPDLYRNSALGMYGGEMEDTNYQDEDAEMDEDDGMGDEMGEFDDETGSEHTSVTDSVDNDEANDQELDIEAGGSTDGWQDEEDEDMDEGEHDSEDEGDDDDDGDGGDQEMVWADAPDGDMVAVDGGDDLDDDDIVQPLPGIADVLDEEGDGVSDADDHADDLSIIEPAEVLQAASDDPFAAHWFGALAGDPNARAAPGLFTNIMPRRRGGDADAELQMFGRRHYGVRLPEMDITTHPLLLDPAIHANGGQVHRMRPTGRRGQSAQYDNLIAAVQEVVGGGAFQFLQHIMQRTRPGETFQLELPAGVISAQLERQPQRQSRSVSHRSGRESRVELLDLQPQPTSARWAEEVQISHGRFAQDRVEKHINHLVLALLPAAREAARIAKEKAAAEELAQEEERKRAEEAAKEEAAKAEEAKAKAEEAAKSPETAPADQPAEAKETDASEASTTNVGEVRQEASDPDTVLSDAATTSVIIHPPEDVDTVMADASPPVSPATSATAAANAPRVPTPPPIVTPSSSSSQPIAQPDSAVEDITTDAASSSLPVPEPAAESAPAAEAEAGPSTQSARIMVTINGTQVDITDTGIDPEFLEALPDEMREEVLAQHLREQRLTREQPPAESQISSEFLDALPAEIRAELLEQERAERRRAQAAAAAAAAAPAAPAPTGPSDMDPASFLATLDPNLRQAVLLEQDENFLQTLPSALLAEAGAFREAMLAGNPRRMPPLPRVAPPAGADGSTATGRKAPVHRDAINLLDKFGIATLVRLLFFPQVSKKNLLHKVLVNLCENGRSRTELLNLLLGILHEGTGELLTVDKSFAQMTVRSGKGPVFATPKSTPRPKASLDAATPMYILSQLPNESLPNLVAQRSLEALSFIVSNNELSSQFFLAEQDLPAGLRRSGSRKGKGKERQVSSTHFPVVALLGLLDRQLVLKTVSIMDSVAALLSVVTKPLTTIKSAPVPVPVPVPVPAPAPAAEPAIESPPSGAEVAPADAPSTGGSTETGPTSSIVADTTLPASASSSSAPAGPSGEQPSSSAAAPIHASEGGPTTIVTSPQEASALASPPVIPAGSLRLIVNILTGGECSGRTFQHSLALIQNLSCIPESRETIVSELRSRAQDLGTGIYGDLDVLAKQLQKAGSDSEAAATITLRFSPASSDQAKLLRVLKTIDYMYSSRASGETISEDRSQDDEAKLTAVYETFKFSSLWRRLGDVLSLVQEKSDVEHTSTVLLPLIEALMVVCKHVGSTTRIRATSPKSPTTPKESMEELFVSFTDAHRKVLNLMVRNNPSLMSGSFSLLVHNPRVLDFDNKRNFFNQQLHRKPPTREHYGTLQLSLRRPRVFEDSFQVLQRKTGDQIKYGKLSVRFYDEEGVDAGGVTREWFQILARQMFNPDYCLFQPCAADKLTYQPNRASAVNPEHLSFFKFVGRVIGKAIYDGRLLDAYFARSLYRQLLGKPVDYRDVEWVDPGYYNSLCWLLENDPAPLEMTFSVEADEFGVTKLIPLKENGASIPVTIENRREFVQLAAEYRLYSSIKEQIQALLGGFYEIIPKDLVAIFNEQELELLISGTPDIDVDEWRGATEYNGYAASDPVIVWWWRALKSFNRDERAKLLSFATGTSRVPLGGFVDLQGVQGVQRFSIHKAYGGTDRLPQAHTCFNQVDLPQYSSYEMLRQQLLLAINEGGEGFGFA